MNVTLLVYAVSSRKEESNGLFAVVTATAGEPRALLAGKGKYTKLAWDEDQKQLAFLSDKDDATAKQPQFRLYLWPRDSAAATELVSAATPGFRELVLRTADLDRGGALSFVLSYCTSKLNALSSRCTGTFFPFERAMCRTSGTTLRKRSRSSSVNRTCTPALLPPACIEVRPGKMPTALAPKLLKMA